MTCFFKVSCCYRIRPCIIQCLHVCRRRPMPAAPHAPTPSPHSLLTQTHRVTETPNSIPTSTLDTMSDT